MTNAGKIEEATRKHTPLPWVKVEGTSMGFEGPDGHICTFEDYPEAAEDCDLVERALLAYPQIEAMRKALASIQVYQIEGEELDIRVSMNGKELGRFPANSESAIEFLKFAAAQRTALKQSEVQP